MSCYVWFDYLLIAFTVGFDVRHVVSQGFSPFGGQRGLFPTSPPFVTPKLQPSPNFGSPLSRLAQQAMPQPAYRSAFDDAAQSQSGIAKGTKEDWLAPPAGSDQTIEMSAVTEHQVDGTTEKPGQTMGESGKETGKPNEKTEMSYRKSEGQNEESEKPDGETEKPDEETEKSDDEAKKSDNDTEKPDDETEKPGEGTEKSTGETTEKPGKGTEKPAETTEESNEATKESKTEPTEMSEETTTNVSAETSTAGS